MGNIEVFVFELLLDFVYVIDGEVLIEYLLDFDFEFGILFGVC